MNLMLLMKIDLMIRILKLVCLLLRNRKQLKNRFFQQCIHLNFLRPVFKIKLKFDRNQNESLQMSIQIYWDIIQIMNNHDSLAIVNITSNPHYPIPNFRHMDLILIDCQIWASIQLNRFTNIKWCFQMKYLT